MSIKINIDIGVHDDRDGCFGYYSSDCRFLVHALNSKNDGECRLFNKKVKSVCVDDTDYYAKCEECKKAWKLADEVRHAKGKF